MRWETPIRIVQCGGAEAHWQGVIARCMTTPTLTLKQERGKSVLAVPAENGSAGLVVKHWRLEGWGDRLKSELKQSKAWRHWRGAETLQNAGVRAATCYAIAHTTGTDRVPVEWLVMDRLPGQSMLHYMHELNQHEAALPLRVQHALSDAVGRAVGAMAARGVYNRDGKPSNWIVTDPAKGQVALIDTEAVRRTLPGLPAFKGWVWMCAALLIEPLGCGCPPRLALQARFMRAFVDSCPVMKNASAAAKRQMRRRLWKAVQRAVAAHGDPRPMVNPLA